MASPNQVWLLCRYLDRNGRGWLPTEQVRRALTGKASAYYLFGWRRLRQVLQAGQGIF